MKAIILWLRLLWVEVRLALSGVPVAGAFFDSRVSKFKIDDTGASLRDLSAYVSEMTGLPGPRPLDEVTAMGDSGSKFIPGNENVPFSISGHFEDTATSGPDAVLGPLRTHTAAVDFEYGPKGDTSGFVKYSGTCWVTNYEIRGQVGNTLTYTCALQVEGVVTRGTF